MPDVQSGLATLTPNGWDVIEPSEGGKFGPQVSGAGNGASAYSVTDKTWTNALAQVLAGVGFARLNCVGDSRTYGSFSAPGATTLRTYSVPAMLVNALANAGIPARADSFFCDQGAGSIAAVTTYDPRIVGNGAWALYTGGSNPESLCGKMFTNSSDAAALAYTPINTWNQVDIWYYRSGASDAFTVDVGGAVLKTVNSGTNNTINKVTVSTADGLTLAAQTLNIKRSAGSVFLIGVECYDTTKPSVLVRNMARPGWNLGNWVKTDTQFASAKGLVAVPADLMVFDSLTNDLSGGVPLYQSRWDTFKSVVLDLLVAPGNGRPGAYALVDPAYVVSSNQPYATQDTFSAEVTARAAAYGVPLLSLRQRFGGYETANTNGLYHIDGIHYLTPGTAVSARLQLERVFGR